LSVGINSNVWTFMTKWPNVHQVSLQSVRKSTQKLLLSWNLKMDQAIH